MSAIFAELWNRVVVSYKSTLIGIGAGIAVEAASLLAAYFGTQPQPWAHVLASLLVVIGASLKSKALPAGNP